MVSFVQLAVIVGSVAFFLLGLIFAIVGYSTFWLIPREEYEGGTSQVDGVGLTQACFTQFRIPQHIRYLGEPFDGCKDNRKNSAQFYQLEQDYWSPDWFQAIQDLHLACIIMMVFNLLFIATYLTFHGLVMHKERKRKRPSIALTMAKCITSLWFILTFIIGIILIAEVIVFYVNYENNKSQFYNNDGAYDYGPGFGITVGAGVCLLISAGLGVYIFILIMRRLIHKSSFNPENEYDKNYDDHNEMDQVSDHEKFSQPLRHEPEGRSQHTVIEQYKDDPYKTRPNSSLPSSSSAKDLVEKGGEKPVPAPRRSLSSKDVSREGSVARESGYTPSAPSSRRGHSPERPIIHSPPQRQMSMPVRPVNPQHFRFDYQPGVGYVPKSARPISEQSAPVFRSPNTPQSVAAAAQYYTPSQRSYAGSVISDAESQRSERVRSTVGQRQSAPNPTQQDKVVTPKQEDKFKKSRYAATAW